MKKLFTYTKSNFIYGHGMELSVLGVPVMKSSICFKSLIERYSVCGLKLFKRCVRKKFLAGAKELLRNFPGYETYVPICSGSGEVFLFLSSLRNNLSSKQLSKTLILCSSPKHLDIARSVDKRFNVELTNSYCFLFIPSNVNVEGGGRIYNPLNAEYFRKTEGYLLAGRKNYFQSLCDDGIIDRHKINFPDLNDLACDKVDNILNGVRLNKSVFLLPTANTICSFNTDSWKQLVAELVKNDYVVYYNAHDFAEPLIGAKSVDFSFMETVYFAAHFSAIVGVRSGMMELVLEVKDVPCLAFYKNFSPVNQIFLTSREVMAGFSLHHLPIKNKDNVIEKDAEDGNFSLCNATLSFLSQKSRIFEL